MGKREVIVKSEERSRGGAAFADNLERLDCTRFVRDRWGCECDTSAKRVGFAGQEEDGGEGAIMCKLDQANSEDRNR
jgi:hypothetical protein